MRLIALMPFLLPVMARMHKQCICNVYDGKSWKGDWQLTFNACTNNYPKTTEYDGGAARCIAMPHVRLDGDRWHDNCKDLAKGGYYPVVNGAIDTTKPRIFAKDGGSTCYD
ncbi:hypothetical protein FOQG_19011 [Fusarium oxysporum f. sp. raphani 54005]|uniref:Uncharacterized protein n=2 Tax=Fusarium oxysporum f. sp. raphani TaxID=96318 RepID=X0B3D7_FUSOX|nr:hypothetical protein FOQG_19011 [Fusarium oxysporum f. sp. raphani 54005]KAG7403899.1 hypothetical protein Forpi1262_v018679 [Fusarium oxysporum f. sp. raphani]